jgi:transposase-like protein
MTEAALHRVLRYSCRARRGPGSRAFTPEFKAEILEVCRRGDCPIGQVARDFDLTETAVREWVRQADLEPRPCARVQHLGVRVPLRHKRS